MNIWLREYCGIHVDSGLVDRYFHIMLRRDAPSHLIEVQVLVGLRLPIAFQAEGNLALRVPEMASAIVKLVQGIRIQQNLQLELHS